MTTRTIGLHVVVAAMSLGAGMARGQVDLSGLRGGSSQGVGGGFTSEQAAGGLKEHSAAGSAMRSRRPVDRGAILRTLRSRS